MKNNTPVMSFDEFRATRREIDAAGMEGIGYTYAGGEHAHGYAYQGGLIIEITDRWKWPTPKVDGKYYLMVERSEYFSDDLLELEQILYRFGIGAGAFRGTCSLCRNVIPEHDAVVFDGDSAFCSDACKEEAAGGTVLHLKASDELRRALENIDLAYDDEGDVLHIVTDTPEETLKTLRSMADVVVVKEEN